MQLEATMTINARIVAVVAIIAGLILAVIGGVALASDVTVLASGNTVSCGDAASPKTISTSACDSAIDSRQMWAWPMIITGAVAALVTLILFPARSKPGASMA